jgi:hypothetical protein
MTVRADLLDRVELDFLPQHFNAGEIRHGFCMPGTFDVDCFGWISYQLLSLIQENELQVLPTCNNLNTQPNLTAEILRQHPILHIRQFNSSLLGFNTRAFKYIKDGDPKGDAIITSNCDNWAVERNVVFRQRFLQEALGVVDKVDKQFCEDYDFMLRQTIKKRGLDINRLHQLLQQVTLLLQ